MYCTNSIFTIEKTWLIPSTCLSTNTRENVPSRSLTIIYVITYLYMTVRTYHNIYIGPCSQINTNARLLPNYMTILVFITYTIHQLSQAIITCPCYVIVLTCLTAAPSPTPLCIDDWPFPNPWPPPCPATCLFLMRTGPLVVISP